MLRITASRRGASLVDVLVTTLLLAVVGVTFSTAFPTGFACARQANGYKVATALAQRKMEQIRTSSFESLTYPLLLASGFIGSEPTSSPYSFPADDDVDGQLTGGTGTVEIEDLYSDLKRVRVTVTWEGPPGRPDRQVQLTSLIADRRTRAVP